MSNQGQEIEAKFYIADLGKMSARLQKLQARLIQARVLETNLRFDLPDGGLRSKGQVLRLRRDTEARLTFKGPGQEQSGVLARREIEFIVEDFERARQFLEALGYRETVIYEKYRATYELDDVLIMLDELPYGNFLEIEGETAEQIHAVAKKLRLDRNAVIRTSYTALFKVAATTLHLTFRDLTFKNFEGIHVTSSDLLVRAADQ
jgi:adenylate cyclase class 2